MGKYCAMRTCKYVDDITPNVKRHRFPSSDLRSKWEQFVREGNRNTRFRAHSSNCFILCERHFEPLCYNSSGHLRKDAVPTIADKFTPEVAFKFGLIPDLESRRLEDINKFSDSVIKHVRTSKPIKNTGVNANSSAVKVLADNLSEDMFGNGTLELMVIDLGEAVTTTDDMLLSSSPVLNEVGTIAGTDTEIRILPRFSSGTNHAGFTEQAPSPPSTRLRSTTNFKSEAEALGLPKTPLKNSEDNAQTPICGCDPQQHKEILCSAIKSSKKALKEFAAQTAELAMLKRSLKNVRRKYGRAMTKIKTLTDTLNQLKVKRRSDQAPQLDSCLYCGKVLN